MKLPNHVLFQYINYNSKIQYKLIKFSLLISVLKCQLTSLSLLMICVSVNCDSLDPLFPFMNGINVSQKYVPPNSFPKQKILEMKNRDVSDIET